MGGGGEVCLMKKTKGGIKKDAHGLQEQIMKSKKKKKNKFKD